MKTSPGHPGFGAEYSALVADKKRVVVGRRKRVLPRGRSQPTMDVAVRAALRGAAARAAKHGVPFDLDTDFVKDRIEKSAGCCEVSGIKFVPDYDPDRRYSHNPYGLSIDRIVPSLGYVRGNVRFVVTAVNFAINQWGIDVYLQIAQATAVKHFRRIRKGAVTA